MVFTLTGFLIALSTLFAVIDILGSVPLIISMRKDYEHVNSLKSTIIATIVLLLSLFIGQYIFSLLGLEVSAFGIAGAIILFILGAEMVLNIEIMKMDPNVSKDATIFPLAFPLIAGPGSISTIMSLNSMVSYLEISLAIIINMLLVFIVLKSTDWISNKLGTDGLNILRKMFGVILLALSSQMLVSNLKILWLHY